MNTENTAKPRWGILDTIDNVWMGNDKGPLIYNDYNLARIAECIVNEMMGTLARYRIREYNEHTLALRDEVRTLCNPETAIKQIERSEL